jgi:polysaccharide biosynthesis transport protein
MQAPQDRKGTLPARYAASTAPVYGAPIVPDPGLSLKDFLAIVWRRRGIVLLTISLITGLAILLAFQLTPRYTATASVMIKPSQVRVIDLGSVTGELPPDRAMMGALVATEVDVIMSDAHARRVVEELGLLADPEFNPRMQPETAERSLLADITDWVSPHWQTAVADISDWVSQSWLTTVGAASQLFALPSIPQPEQADPQPEQADDIPQPSAAEYDRQIVAGIRQLHESLQVSQSGDSYVISIAFTSTDSEKAAQIANTFAELYVVGQRGEKLAATKEAATWLANRAEQLRQVVLKSENAIEQYRAANRIVSGQGESLGEQELANLNLELLKARAELAEKEVRLRRAREVRGNGASYETLAEVMSSPVVIALRQEEAAVLQKEAQLAKEYGSLHPIMVELAAQKKTLASKIDLEVGNIIANLENEVAVARSRERALAEALEEAKDRSAVTSQAGVQLRQLEREAEANRDLYQTFLTRLKQTEEQLDLVRSDATIVSPAAIPQEPSFPKPKLMIGVGFTSSAMLGILLALLRERLSSTFRTGRELHEALGVASFGLVPSIHRSRRLPSPHRYLIEKPLSAYADAIRSVQKSLELSCLDQRQFQVVLVTSTLPGEGKTTLALSLAASAARSGRKTIVIDVDLRHPSVAREIGQPFGPGLVEFLAGEATADDIIHTAEFQTNLDFIPIKALTSSPVNLLESQELAVLLAGLRTRYDYIFLDGPPALITDTRAAALLADTVLFAVQWDKTKAEVVSHGLEAFAGSPVSVSGLVMTQVNLKRHAKYGYGDVASYYREYRKYYSG